MKLGPLARTFLSVQIGIGLTALFWHDNWTSLINLTGANGPRVTGIPRLSTVLNDSWNLPRVRHKITLLLRSCLPCIVSDT